MAKTSYVISERIAQGGMAEIYLGKAVGDDAFQRIVAIKRILPHYSRDREFVAMFRDEAHICKRLQHANIVQVYDFTEVEKSYALIMEYVDGADFRTLLAACEAANRRLSVPMVLYIIAASARGLHYAHTKADEISHKPLGIVHRDISPQNILVSFEGEVKITDFGIASADDKVTETRPGIVKGKYSYMSPEQVAAKHLDGRTDIFSLAVVLWEALTMKRLFAGKSEVETIRKVQSCEIPNTITDLNSEVSDELARIVHRGLARETKDRFQTAAEFEKALLKYLNSNYPDFLASQLGEFLKQILAEKFDASRAAQKKTLTNTDLKPLKSQPTGTKHLRSSRDIGTHRSPQKEGENTPKIAIAGGVIPLAQAIHREGPRSNLAEVPRPVALQSPLGAKHKSPESAIHIKPAIKESRQLNKTMIAVLGIVVVAVLGFISREKFFEQDMLQLELNTEPKVVQIYLNGRNIQSIMAGRRSASLAKRYTLTTKPLLIPPLTGLQRVELRRQGYRVSQFNFDASKEDTIHRDITLVRDPNINLVQLKIIADQKVLVDLNRGMMKGISPFIAPGIAAGKSHIAYIKSASGARGSCQFVLPQSKAKLLYLKIETSPKVRCLPRLDL